MTHLSQRLEILMKMSAQNDDNSGDYNRVLKLIAESAQPFFQPDVVTILPVNPITNDYILPAIYLGNLHKPEEALRVEPRSDGITSQVLAQTYLFADDLAVDKQWQTSFTKNESFRSFVAVTLGVQKHKKPLAALYLSWRTLHKFDDDFKAWLRLFVEQASNLLQNAWFQHRNQVLAEIDAEINQHLDSMSQIFARLYKHLVKILDARHCFMLARYRAQTDTFDLYVNKQGVDTLYEKNPMGGICQRVLHSGESFRASTQFEIETFLGQPIVEDSVVELKDTQSCMFVPLILCGVRLGVLAVQSPCPDAFDDQDFQILELLGNQITLVLNTNRLFTSLSRLNEVGLALTQKMDTDDILLSVVEQVREATKADSVVVYPVNRHKGQFLNYPSVSGQLRYEQSLQHPKYATEQSAPMLTLQQQKPIFASDSNTLAKSLGGKSDQIKGNFIQRELIRSVVAAPLQVHNEPVGALFINFLQHQLFDDPQKTLIQGVANYAAIAIRNSGEFDAQANRRIQELEALRKIDRAISESLELEPTLQTILNAVMKQTTVAGKGVILLYDRRKETLARVATKGYEVDEKLVPEIPLSRDKGITRWVFQNKQSVRVDNLLKDDRWHNIHIPVIKGVQILSELDVPLMDDNEIIGVINLESIDEAAFTEADQQFLEVLAGQAVLAIKNAQTYERSEAQRRNLEALHRIDKKIVEQSDNPINVMRVILESAISLTGSSEAILDNYAQGFLVTTYYACLDEQGEVDFSELLHDPEEVFGRKRGIMKHVADLKKPYVTSADAQEDTYYRGKSTIKSELAVPLLAESGKVLIGVLDVESQQPYNYDQNDVETLELLAGQAVIALQSARQNGLLQTAAEVSQAVISILEPDALMQRVVELVQDRFDVYYTALFLLNETGEFVKLSAATGEQGQKLLEQEFQIPISRASMISWVAEHKIARLAPNVEVDEIYWRPDDSSETRSELDLPLIHQNQVIGVLSLQSRRHAKFSQADIDTLQTMANQVAIALQNAHNFTQAKREAKRFERLNQVGQRLAEVTGADDLDQAYKVVTQILATRRKSQVIIRRLVAGNNQLEVVLITPKPDQLRFEIVAVDDSVDGQAILEGRTLLINDVNNPDEAIKVEQVKTGDDSIQSIVVTPIQFEEITYGTLALTHQKPHYFDNRDKLFIEGLANQLAITIHRLETARRERASAAMSAIGQQAFELTHRLGNDLGLVRSYVNNIHLKLEGHTSADSDILAELDNIVADVTKVLTLSSTLKQELTEFNIEKGRAAVPIGALLEEARQIVKSLTNKIRVQYDIGKGVASIKVHINHGQIAAILENLVVNAIQAMDKEDEGVITLRARTAGRDVIIGVADTGPGISEARQKRIFDLFYSTKGSSGFGLWSARRNALLHDGDLTVKSQLGQGATFILSLPQSK